MRHYQVFSRVNLRKLPTFTISYENRLQAEVVSEEITTGMIEALKLSFQGLEINLCYTGRTQFA